MARNTQKTKAIYQSLASIPLLFYGFAFHRVVTSLTQIPLQSVEGARIIPMWIVPLLIALIVFLIGPRRTRAILLPCGIVMQLLSIGLLACLYYGVLSGAAVLTLASIAGSIGNASLSALWVDIYARLNPARAMWCIALSMVIAQCFVFLVAGNSMSKVFICLGISPLVALICYIGAIKSKDAEISDGEGRAKPSRREHHHLFVPYKALLFIGAYSFAYGLAFMRDDILNMRYAAVIPCLIAIAFLLINDKKFNVSVLLRFAFPLMIGGLLLASFVTGNDAPMASGLINAGFATVEILLLLIVCTISYSTGSSAIWLFAISFGVQSIMRSLGSLCGNLLVTYASFPHSHELVSTISIVAVVLTSTWLMTEKSLFSFWRFRDGCSSEGECNGGSVDYLKVRAKNLGELYNLTDREIELLFLLMQGKSNMEIARDLIISEGTVKSHLHHIYRKLNVHSRKEILSLVKNSAEDRAQ